MRPSEQRPELSVSFSGSCPPKLSLSLDINPECASRSVVMETDSLGEREPENETDNFGHYPLGSFLFLGLSGSL